MKRDIKFALPGLLMILLVALVSCEKNNVAPEAQTIVPSKMDLLTRHVFIYDSVINNWGLPNQSIAYARTGSNNPSNWSNERLKFYRDGTFDEILTTGIWRQGSWSMNTDSTTLFTSGAGYSNNVIIVTLSSTKLVWLDNANKVRGVQIPKL